MLYALFRTTLDNLVRQGKQELRCDQDVLQLRSSNITIESGYPTTVWLRQASLTSAAPPPPPPALNHVSVGSMVESTEEYPITPTARMSRSKLRGVIGAPTGSGPCTDVRLHGADVVHHHVLDVNRSYS